MSSTVPPRVTRDNTKTHCVTPKYTDNQGSNLPNNGVNHVRSVTLSVMPRVTTMCTFIIGTKSAKNALFTLFTICLFAHFAHHVTNCAPRASQMPTQDPTTAATNLRKVPA